MRIVKLMLVAGLALAAFGCWEPESSYNKLVEEKEALLMELHEAETEGRILDKALKEIYRERDGLLTKINNLENARQRLLGESAPAAGNVEAEADSAAGTGSARIYRVKAGDTLSAVADAHGVPFQAILKANPTVANRPDYILHVGQDLVIP